MLRDWQTPAAVEPAATETRSPGEARAGENRGGARDPETPSPDRLHAHWNTRKMELLARELAAGAAELGRLPAARLSAAWTATVETFREPESAARRALDPALVRTTGLSPEGLDAALETVLGGVAGDRAVELLRETRPAADPSLVLVVLASNLPALAVQPLLPILARRRPAVLKSPSAEPLFAAAFAAELARREPILERTVAALAWPGGDAGLEAPLLAAAGRVLAYGDAPALADLQRRADAAGPPGRVVPYGPKTSLAVVGPGILADLQGTAAGIARDVALFDQRGCLSIAAVYVLEGAGGAAEEGAAHGRPVKGEAVEGEPVEGLAARLADALAGELVRLARRWPLGGGGPAALESTAAARQVREEASLLGLRLPPLPFADGTVVVDPRPAFRPTPGLRTVRIHPVAGAAALEEALAGWTGHLQGAALAGLDAATHGRVHHLLYTLGVSRFASPGDLQAADVRWHNGGVDPLAVLG